MSFIRLNPFNELDNFKLDSWFNPAEGSQVSKKSNSSFLPRVNVFENETSFVIEAELAGVSKDAVDVQIENNILTFSGEKKSELADKKAHRVERYYGKFSRSFSLPDNVDQTNIKAESKDGMLFLTLPKMKPEETRTQIKVH